MRISQLIFLDYERLRWKSLKRYKFSVMLAKHSPFLARPWSPLVGIELSTDICELEWLWSKGTQGFRFRGITEESYCYRSGISLLHLHSGIKFRDNYQKYSIAIFVNFREQFVSFKDFASQIFRENDREHWKHAVVSAAANSAAQLLVSHDCRCGQ